MAFNFGMRDRLSFRVCYSTRLFAFNYDKSVIIMRYATLAYPTARSLL